MKPEQLPNALCIFRIILVVPVLWAIFNGRYEIALLLFVIAGFTDGLDGFLARHFDWRTALGAILDPVADKLLMSTVVIALCMAGLIPIWLVVVLVGRDAVIVSGAISYRLLIGPFEGKASTVSKMNTAIQLLYVTTVLANAAFMFPNPLTVTILGSLVFVTAVISGLHYVRDWTSLAIHAGEKA